MRITGLKQKSMLLFRDLDLFLAITGMILSCFLIILGGVKASIMALLIGFLLLFSCLVWMMMRSSDPLSSFPPTSNLFFKVSTILFFTLFTASIVEMYLRPVSYERPLLYFFCTALMAGAIAGEIASGEQKYAGFILLQILLLGISISWTGQAVSPGLIGSDPWYHADLTNRIVSDSFLPKGFSYATMPLFHLTVATTSLLSAIPYKQAAMLSVSIGQIICNALFVYLLGNFLLSSYRIGLLASLLAIISNLNIFMSYWSIPNAFGAIFLPIILYLIIIGKKEIPKKFYVPLVSLFMIAIILTHSIVAICTSLILFIAYIASVIYQYYNPEYEKTISWLIPVGFTIGMLSWWNYMTNYLSSVSNFIRQDFSLFTARGTVAQTLVPPLPPLEYLFSILGQYLFFTLSIIGLFYMVSQKKVKSTFVFAFLSVTPLIISFVAYFAGSQIITFRWLYIAQILLSIPLSLALCAIASWKAKKPILIYCFFFIFLSALCLFTLMSPEGNNDSMFFTPVTGKSSFLTQHEISGDNFFSKHSIGTLSLDNYNAVIFQLVYHFDYHRLIGLESELLSGKFIHDNSIKIIRTRNIEQLRRTGVYTSGDNSNPESSLSKNGFNKIYSNSYMTGYLAQDAA